ncbi:MAG: LutB/LldF family L-lactate oxidation iron-sulfur protein [Actinomycetota bacterium]
MTSSSPYDYSKGFRDRSLVSLGVPTIGPAIKVAVDRQASSREAGFESLKDYQGLRVLAASVRDYNLSHLDEHLERLAETWEAAGGKLFFASDAEEARDYVLGVARRLNARTVVKSKSMVSEEISLNSALEKQGIQPVETDLGQYIVQVAGEPPSHITAPSIHKSQSEINELFSELAGEPLPNDATLLTRFARDRLRKNFLSAELGISGVNLAVADAGTLCLVTNEGNGRMCTSMPRAHVAIMGMERVVWDFDQLAVILNLLARSNTGQKLSQYTSLVHGPKRANEADGPEEAHLVILDNGRSNVLGSRYHEALRCIRCGACLNVCPVFRQVGGHVYDPVYSGPIGAIITPLLKETEQANELPHTSTLCGACTDVCPVKIPLHDFLLRLRMDHAHEAPLIERGAYKAWSLGWATSRRFAWFRRAVAVMGRVTGGRPVKRLPLPLVGRWTRGRALPGLPRGRKQREGMKK